MGPDFHVTFIFDEPNLKFLGRFIFFEVKIARLVNLNCFFFCLKNVWVKKFETFVFSFGA